MKVIDPGAVDPSPAPPDFPPTTRGDGVVAKLTRAIVEGAGAFASILKSAYTASSPPPSLPATGLA